LLFTQHASPLGAQSRCARGACRYRWGVASVQEQVRHAVWAVGRTLSKRLLHRLSQHLGCHGRRYVRRARGWQAHTL
jgi:hypothetical protein